MTTVHYEAQTRRLRISGACPAADRAMIHDALETFAGMAGGHLIVDMTAVSDLDPLVARDLVATARDVSQQGVSCVFLRRGGPVDDVLKQAEAPPSDTEK